MLIHRYKSYVLIAASFFAVACSGMQPNHYGKYVFKGVVHDDAGKPVPNAWVKVRGWETLTDATGHWSQEQMVHCGTMSDSVGTHDENDAVLVTAKGYEPVEEAFIVKHPGWFQSCEADKVIAFETVLPKEGAERKESRQAGEFKSREEKVIPWPAEKKAKAKGGGTSL